MRLRALGSLTAILLLAAAACGGGDGSTSSAAGGSGTGTGTGTGTGVGGMGDGGMGTGGTGQGGMGSGAGGMGPDCSNLPDGPITPELVSSQLNGSEDLAFDGKGHIAGKAGNNVALLDAMDMLTADYGTSLPGTTLGLRFMKDGTLIAASNGLRAIPPGGGAATAYAPMVNTNGANGVFVDFDDNVWVTRFNNNQVLRIDAALGETTIASGGDADQANGVVLHPNLPVLYYTEYSQARIHRVDVSGNTFTPVQIAEIPGAALDGMVMDACGNLYVVDNGNDRLYRQLLDADGQPIGTPVELASFPTNVANAQFGSGTGWDGMSLYAAGFPGDVYRVQVGVSGAPTPPAP